MPRKLLLADDSVTIQKVVAIVFAHEDFQVTAVANGEEAIARAREIQPDVVLADVVMPGKDGYEVCAALKADPATSHIPVLLLAGTFEPFDEARAQEAGFDGHMPKPFESLRLVERVRQLIDGPRNTVAAPPSLARAAPVQPPAPTSARPPAPTFAPPRAPAFAPPPAPPAPSFRPPAPPAPRPPPSVIVPPRAPAPMPPPAVRPPAPAPAAAAFAPPPPPSFARPAPVARPWEVTAGPARSQDAFAAAFADTHVPAPQPVDEPDDLEVEEEILLDVEEELGDDDVIDSAPAALQAETADETPVAASLELTPGPDAFALGAPAAPAGKPAVAAQPAMPAVHAFPSTPSFPEIERPLEKSALEVTAVGLRFDKRDEASAMLLGSPVVEELERDEPAEAVAPFGVPATPPESTPTRDALAFAAVQPAVAVAEAVAAAPAVSPASEALPAHDGGEAALRAALSAASREVIEKIAWEVVPQLAEVILREHVERLVKARERGEQV